MRIALTALIATCLIVPVPAAAQNAPPAAAQDPAQPKAEEKVICKGDRALEFGSHRRSKKVCRTDAEWKLLEKGTQRELQAFRERAQTHGDAIGR